MQTDHHLIRCLSYIDLNMVRAGEVCHPRQWEVSGYHEIQSPRQRKAIIDHKTLCELVGKSNIDQLQNAHNVWVNDALKQSRHDPVWTDSVAVSDKNFLAHLKRQLGVAGLHIQMRCAGDAKCLKEPGVPQIRGISGKIGQLVFRCGTNSTDLH